jgi:hypothetical protein
MNEWSTTTQVRGCPPLLANWCSRAICAYMYLEDHGQRYLTLYSCIVDGGRSRLTWLISIVLQSRTPVGVVFAIVVDVLEMEESGDGESQYQMAHVTAHRHQGELSSSAKISRCAEAIPRLTLEHEIQRSWAYSPLRDGLAEHAPFGIEFTHSRARRRLCWMIYCALDNPYRAEHTALTVPAIWAMPCSLHPAS